jgi:Tol biopolymer transport system component
VIRITLFFLTGLIFSISQVKIYSQSGGEIDYLGQTPPGNIPEVFAPGIISINNSRERCLTISPNGDEIFFCRVSFPYNKIYHSVKTDTGWTTPEVADFSTDIWATEPSFSPDGQYLYFSSSKGKSAADNYSLWRVKKNETGWGEPESLVDITENNIWEFHPQVTSDGTIYFCYWQGSSGKIYVSELVNGQYSIPIGLPSPINSQYSDTDPYVDPEGKYLIFKSTRPGGIGSDDGYISLKKDDGTWTNPKNLGPIVNTTASDDVGDISPDGKYLFFTRNNDIYWVSTYFIDSLKFSKYLSQEAPGTIPKRFPLSVNDNTFASDRIAITSDGKEIYYSEISDINWAHYKIKYYRYSDNNWKGPYNLFDNFMAPALSADGNQMFIENYANNKSSYYSERNDSSWNAPAASVFLKNPNDKHYMQITDSGRYYVSSNNSVGGNGMMDISRLIFTEYDTIVQSLGSPLNSNGNEGDFFISKDESFIIFASPHRGGFGGPDLFISFKESDNWSIPVNLGSTINTQNWDFGPYVTADNKYLFFTSGSNTSNLGIYWVEVDKLIDSLRESIPTSIIDLEYNTISEFDLEQNFPNPFNPATEIRYSLRKPSFVILIIYNLQGQEIKTLQNSFQNAGQYSTFWNGTDDKDNPVSSGIYFYRLQTDESNLQKKMILIR